MKKLGSLICFLICVFGVNYSLAAERIFHEDCEATNFSQHFLERNYGTTSSDRWNEFRSEVTRSGTAHSGSNSMTYNPHQTGNPQGRVGYSTSYGNTSHFRLANHSSRYWYFRWYQRWETGIDWGGSCQNKTFYLNYVGMGDFTFTVQRNCSNCFLIKSVPNGSGTQIVDYANHSGGNLDDEEWHKLEL